MQDWYDYTDINRLLHLKSNNFLDYLVVDATSEEDLNLLQRVSEAVELLNVNQESRAVAIPINLGGAMGNGKEIIGLL